MAPAMNSALLMVCGMTERQLEIARHALGLDGRRKVSYRNRFVAGEGHPAYADLMEMTRTGLAIRPPGFERIYGGDSLFVLTKECAERALRRGERLDSEDWAS